MKTRWSRAQAAKHVDAWVTSGKSVEAFAADQQLPAQRLRYWQKRLAVLNDGQRVSAPPALLPCTRTGTGLQI